MYIRTDNAEGYRADGTYYGLYGYEGFLGFSGFYLNDETGGTFPITSGTGDFAGARGLVTSVFDEVSGLSIRTIYFE
jgi:hypothetical protein